MDFLQPDVQDKLMKEHFEFRKLMEEHRAADERLVYLRNKIRLSAQETVGWASRWSPWSIPIAIRRKWIT